MDVNQSLEEGEIEEDEIGGGVKLESTQPDVAEAPPEAAKAKEDVLEDGELSGDDDTDVKGEKRQFWDSFCLGP